MMKSGLLVLLLAACGGSSTDAPDATAHCTPGVAPVGEVVTTTVGAVRGVRDGNTFAFKRVPFAAPPVGDLRYRPPEPAACSAAELDATTFGPRCPQLEDGTYVGDEDCLHLNVWAPAAESAPRPVMVWIHGGGNSQGTATVPLFDGRRLAEAGDVIVVTVNYRLGQLGFLGHPSFGEGTGVFGLLDQIAALQWVHDNIAAFGGDPANVTIFGESAGARDVCSLVASPPAKGLFQRAIMQSGSCRALPSRTAAEQTAAEVAAAAGCGGASDVAACMRAQPAESIIRALPATVSALASSPYQPMIDGVVQTAQPATVIAAGGHAQVPFVIGANADETGSSAPAITTEAQYISLVQSQFPQPLADAVLQQYPASAYPSPRAAYVRMTTDARFVCPSREIAKAADAGQAAPVYRYFFQYRASPYGAVHGLDVPFIFGTLDSILVQGQPYQPSATDLAVSSALQGYWTRFARTGDPGGTPAWPTYDASDPSLVIDATVSTTTAIRATNCDFWQPYYN